MSDHWLKWMAAEQMILDQACEIERLREALKRIEDLGEPFSGVLENSLKPIKIAQRFAKAALENITSR